MEQLKINKKHEANLTEAEKKNVFLAVASGCFYTIHNMIPGPPHKKQKRTLRQLGDEIIHYAGRRIPKVEDENMQLFKDTITASGIVLDQILEETGSKGANVMLNLAGFCLDELPLDKRHYQRYNALFDLWEDAVQYKDIKSGERIFTRIEAELQILVTQRGGVIL